MGILTAKAYRVWLAYTHLFPWDRWHLQLGSVDVSLALLVLTLVALKQLRERQLTLAVPWACTLPPSVLPRVMLQSSSGQAPPWPSTLKLAS